MNNVLYVGVTGIAGWNALQRMESRYIETVSKDPTVTREIEYFKSNFTSETDSQKLVGDFRMLSVALKAFGLEGDIANKAFIRKVLESDLSDEKSLANRLSDKRYLRLAEAFSFSGNDEFGETRLALTEQISEAFIEREFERRIGEGDANLRLALNARRELMAMSSRDSSDTTLWYEVLGNPPLRSVFTSALSLPENFSKLPIDRQYSEITSRAVRHFGTSSFSAITSSGSMDQLINNFLARSQLQASPSLSSYEIALSILS